MGTSLKAVFGISRSHGGAQVQDAARKFAERLSAMSSIEVHCTVEADYDRLFEALKAGRVSMAWLPPLLYSRAAVEGLRLVAVPERGGGVALYSAILVPTGSPYFEPSSLRDVRAAWVDPRSASGYAFPRQHLLSSGATFSVETFHGSPNFSCAEVLAGRADLSTCPVSTRSPAEANRHVARVLGSSANELRILSITGTISPDGVVISRATPAEVAAQLDSLVLRLHEDRAGLAAIRELFRAERMITPGESTRRMMPSAR
jgi:phosphonate transport system substrate-binding protein